MIKAYDSKSIDLHKIKSISRGDEGLWKTLSFGFLRACSEEQLSKLLITHIYEKPAFSWIFRRYLEHFDELIKFPAAEESQIRKLFARKAKLSAEDWKWLESEFPDSILYVAAKRGHILTDEECFRFLGKSRKSRSRLETFQYKEFDNQDGLKFWCLAKLGKWEVINALLRKQAPSFG